MLNHKSRPTKSVLEGLNFTFSSIVNIDFDHGGAFTFNSIVRRMRGSRGSSKCVEVERSCSSLINGIFGYEVEMRCAEPTNSSGQGSV
jgi:hypothetical protein